MTCRMQKKRARNWRSSKNNQLFRSERNFRMLEDLFWLKEDVKARAEGKEPEEGEHDFFDTEPKKWLRVIEETFKYFQQDDGLVGDILVRRYIRNEGFPKSCCDLDIGDNKYYRARDAGLQYARECAIQLGLIKAFEE